MAKKRKTKLEAELAGLRAEATALGESLTDLASNIAGRRDFYTGNPDLTDYLTKGEKTCRTLAAQVKAVRMPLFAAQAAADQGFEEQTTLEGQGDGDSADGASGKGASQ